MKTCKKITSNTKTYTTVGELEAGDMFYLSDETICVWLKILEADAAVDIRDGLIGRFKLTQKVLVIKNIDITITV